MADKQILHMVTPLKHMSPFDVNMALDAGYDAAIAYTGVTLEEITALVQDAMFSRPPKVGVRTAMFFGGKNAVLALDMLAAAKKAMVPPFGISLLADPAGSFTTAAAMVARVEHVLKTHHGRSLEGLKVAVFGATGVVGFSSAVIAALNGAKVTLVGYDGIRRVSEAAREITARFKVDAHAADGSDAEKQTAILLAADVALCAGRAGVQILSAAQLATAKDLLLVADVNAVPPLGVEGLKVDADGVPVTTHGALGIGALAIGPLKSRTESGLLRQMIAATKPLSLDFRDAFALARSLHG
ncbi:MAG TPA: NAD(P)-dependent methylenetetrahydromethanopterin dehydrogenase [Xanthobacteraceae bacterium]|nr:NAD(P)-dependent methylenetetrahydromethanopterin dehydrogenase [Xanthobacteraceae bacterium]